MSTYEHQLGLVPEDEEAEAVRYPCADGTAVGVYLGLNGPLQLLRFQRKQAQRRSAAAWADLDIMGSERYSVREPAT